MRFPLARMVIAALVCAALGGANFSFAQDGEDETLIETPQTSMIGSPKNNKTPGGDYGLGDPLYAPQYTLRPKASGAKGDSWWCNPCGFGGWGCGTPVRTAARNFHTQMTSLLPCGPWCQSRGCNCSGQGPYVMDGSQPDRRSRPCDCQGSYYLFPWIWGYNPSRKGCCINQWTQRGDGYRSGLQFNKPATAQVEDVEPEAAPEPPAPGLLEAPKTTSRKVRNVSHETASKKSVSATIREVEPSGEEAEPETTEPAVKKPRPTGVLSANYIDRMAPRSDSEPQTQVSNGLSKGTSSRRR